MRFGADLYFDFDGGDSWRLFLLLTRAEEEGVTLDVQWIGLDPSWDGGDAPLRGGQRALAMHAAVHDFAKQRLLRQALFTLAHRQGDSFEDDLTLLAAAKVAGLDGEVMLGSVDTTGRAELRRNRQAAASVGVLGVPSMVRGGPPLLVGTTAALDEGPARRRLEVIDGMLDDDGLWHLSKP